MVNAMHLAALVQILLAATANPAPAVTRIPRSASPAGAADYVCLEPLSPRVVLAYWLGVDRRCNLTAIASAKGLVLIDTEMSPRIMAPIQQRLEQHFGRNDWTCVINTHAHDNHAGGNSLFPAAALIGHENLAADMQWLIRRQTEPDWKARELDAMATTIRNFRALLPRYAGRRTDTRRILGEITFWELHAQDLQEGYPIVPPATTFADRRTIDLGDLTVELTFFGRGHSTSDTLVYIPQEKLLVSGAIAYQRAQLPEIGEQTDLTDIQRFLTILDSLLAPETKIDRVIPSHSPPLRKADLKPVRDYYQKMLVGMRQARRDNLTLDQTMERLSVRNSFPNFRDPPPGHWAHGMQQRNIRNLWRILSGDPDPAPPMPASTHNHHP